MDPNLAKINPKLTAIQSQLVQSMPPRCFKCKQLIREAHLLLADQQYWHEDCLRCVCCEVRLAELDKVFYVKADMPLCRRDYLRLYGQTGECFVCHKRILAFEFVMRIHSNVYHLNCFSCQQCQLRFCVGDKFYLHNQSILCEQDYAYLVLASLQPRLFTPSGAQTALLRARYDRRSLSPDPSVWPTLLSRDFTVAGSAPVQNSATIDLCAQSVSEMDECPALWNVGRSRLNTRIAGHQDGEPVQNDKDDDIEQPRQPAFEETNELWSKTRSRHNSIGRQQKTLQAGDDHSSGYGSPSPTLSASTQLDPQ